MINTQQLYIQAIKCTQLLHSILNCYIFYQLYQLGTGAREYKAFSSPSHVILHITSYIALCSYYLFTSTQKDRQAPTIRVHFTKMLNKYK